MLVPLTTTLALSSFSILCFILIHSAAAAAAAAYELQAL